MGAICRGPMGNHQGGHYFISLATGERLVRSRWTALLMPCEVQSHVNKFGKKQKMPKTLTFADWHGHEIHDNLEQVGDWNDEDDESYQLEVDKDDDKLSYDTVDNQPQDADDIDAPLSYSLKSPFNIISP